MGVYSTGGQRDVFYNEGKREKLVGNVEIIAEDQGCACSELDIIIKVAMLPQSDLGGKRGGDTRAGSYSHLWVKQIKKQDGIHSFRLGWFPWQTCVQCF